MVRRSTVLGWVALATFGGLAACKTESSDASTATSTSTTSTGAGGTGGAGGTSSGGAGGAAASSLYVYSTTHDIPSGGTYDSHDGATIMILTSSQDPFTIQNKADGAITIESIEVVREGQIQAEEFGYLDKDIKPNPFAPASLEKDAKLDYYLNCSPAASGERKATIKIKYSGAASGEHAYSYLCHGTPGADFSVDPATVKARVYGGPGNSEDEMMGTLVADAAGNVYMTSTSELAQDRLNLVQVKADGSLGWAKQFSATHDFKAPDSLQNGQTGGTSGSLTMGSDGNLYLIAQASWTASNNNYYVYAAKIAPATGAILWEKAWGRVAQLKVGSDSSNPYAIDATSNDYVYITGTTQDSAQVLALALKKSDGSIFFQKQLEVVAQYNDKGFALRYDPMQKALYIGGQRSGNAGLLVRMNGVDTASPTLGWAKSIDLGTGGQVTGLDVDTNGNVYTSMRIAASGTAFLVGSVDPTGTLRWSKNYVGNPSDTNDAHVVRIADGSLWAAGRLATPNFDSQFGDGLLVKIDPATGAEQASAFYFSGKKVDQLAEHRVKGLAVANGKLLLGMQAYTATQNGVRYSGYWYKNPSKLDDAKLTLTDEPGAALSDIATGAVHGPNDANVPALGVTYADTPKTFVYQSAESKHDGTPPDADMMFIEMPQL